MNFLPPAAVFVAGFLAGTPPEGASVHSQNGDSIAFNAKDYTSISNPDALNDVQNSVQTGSAENPIRIWTSEASASSLSGSVLRATPSPHRQQNDASLQESIASYEVSFTSAGSYKLYVRSGNNGTSGNQSTDSIWVPASLGEANPSSSFTTPSTGDIEWKSSVTYTVTAGEVGSTLTFNIGVREPDARIDAFVLSTQTSLTSTQLDALFDDGPDPTPTPTPTPTPANWAVVCTVSEFNTALAAALPGDTIALCDGTWTDAALAFNGKSTANGSGGTSGSPITLRAQTYGDVILTGSSKITIAGEYMTVDGLVFEDGAIPEGGAIVMFRTSSSNLASNCRLTNTVIRNYNPASASTDYDWVSVYGTNNRIDHCRLEGMNHIGVTLVVWQKAGGPPNATQIDRNHFLDRAPGSGNGYETIRIGTSEVSLEDSNAIVEYNLFERCDGEIEIISNKSVGNVYRFNTFSDSSGELTLRHGMNCTVEGNFFLGNNKSGSGGVRLIGPGHVVTNNYFQDLRGRDFRAAICIMNGVPDSPLNRYLQAVNCTIAYNTIVNCREAFAVGTVSGEGDTTLPPDTIVFANNVMQTASSSNTLVNYYTTPLNMTYEGNFAYGASLGITNPGGISTSNPQLSLAADGWYRPDASSPVIGAAEGSYPEVTTDIEGQPRDGAPDSGADEVSTDPATLAPLAEADVGPEWMNTQVPVLLDSWMIE